VHSGPPAGGPTVTSHAGRLTGPRRSLMLMSSIGTRGKVTVADPVLHDPAHHKATLSGMATRRCGKR
jgi:hypothetical protein